MMNLDNQGTFVHFSKAEEYIFSFFYSTKLYKMKLPNALSIFIMIVQSLQLLFLPLKRSDAQDIGITPIIKTVGLYLDPSFHIPSNISHIIIIGIIIAVIITSITLHIITYVLHMNDAKIPDDLLHIVWDIHEISSLLSSLKECIGFN
ncbi:MAG: hypothetical protein EZS28_039757 [Streblomastix strix]|uniref:Uncharacterized protein n=1 Tax=Streblomastix strix TaxID=222440 RepID=A0A5J4U2F0_9EUKA|nr:MAG: hypothetical protein EZS28_039757 [Streblomastix strix]